jgi:hypothetical protein
MSNDEGAIDRGAFDRDQQSAVRDGLAALDAADLEAASQTIETAPWARTFVALSPDIAELKYRIVNADLTPQQDAALESVMGEAIESHIVACDEGGG